MGTVRADLSSSAPRTILVRGVNWLGDAVMTIPALTRIRERWPAAEITLLSHEKISGLWRNHSAINQAIPFNSGESVWSVSRRLRTNFMSEGRAGCDLGIVLPNSPRSALELRLAGVTRRVGYARPWRNWLLTDAIPERPGHVAMQKRSAAEVRRLTAENSQPCANIPSPNPNAHQMLDYLHLAGAIGADPKPLAPGIPVLPEEMAGAAHKFSLQPEHFEHLRPLLGLNPGAQYGPAKRWPVERFIAAAVEIERKTRCRWLIFGGSADQEIAEEIARRIGQMLAETTHFGTEFVPPVNLAGRTDLRDLCALFKLCRVVLTNDSGPMHLAAAVGTPVVVPFGSTSPELTGPGMPGEPRHKLLRVPVPCSPCFRRTCPIDLRCLTGIERDDVVQAVLAAAAIR